MARQVGSHASRRDLTEVALNIRRMSPALRNRFKVWCAERGIAMEWAVTRILEETVAGRIQPNMDGL